MYYLLNNAKTRKQVGTQFQTKGFVDNYDIDGPNSRVHLKYDEFPDFVPDLRFELEEKAKLTDVVKPDNISLNGFLINEKVKRIFEQCRLPEHRYFEASLLDQEGNVHPYYWLHLISNAYQMVDFSQSVFRKSDFPLKMRSTKNDPIYPIKDLDNFLDTKNSLFDKDEYIVLDVLKIRNCQSFDMLYFGNLWINAKIISERMAELLKKEKITGIDITENLDIEDLY